MDLSSDGRRVVYQEVARSAGGVVRIRNLCSRRATATLGCVIVVVAVVAEEALVVGSTPLPTHMTWPTANVTIAVAAVPVVQQLAAGAAQ
jgi:hypothetical protein